MSTDPPGGGGPRNPWMQWMSGFAQMAQGPAGQVYREWETWMGAQLERLARSESFVGHMAKTMESSFAMKSMAERALEASAKAMRLPSAGDLGALTERMDALERRVAEVASGLQKLTRAVEARAKASKEESP